MAEEIRRHPNGRDYKRGADGKWHLVQTGPQSISLTGPDLTIGPKIRQAQNEADASESAPGKAATDARTLWGVNHITHSRKAMGEPLAP